MHATDPTFPLYPILSLLAFIVSFIPFPWHFRSRNVGTCSYMLSTGFLALVGFINSIIWKDNVNNVAPVWCDISAQIIIAANVGITASTLAISRQLYNISKVNRASATSQEKRRDMIINLLIAFGLPVLVMGLHFIVQPRRFDIFEEIGCQPATFNTLAAYILYFMWPVLIGLCSLVYSVLTLRNLYSRRVEFAKVAGNGSGMSPSRYIRLMLLVFVDMICNTPIGVFSIIAASRSAVLPFTTFSETVDFSKIEFVPASEWKADTVTRAVVEINRWVPPVFCAFVFFAFFGFAEEAKKNYKKGFESVKRIFSRGQSRDRMQATTPKPKSKAWSMISSNAKPSFSMTESTVAPSYYSDNDKYTPDDSYLYQTETGTINSPSSPPSCSSSLRPLIAGTGASLVNTLQNQPPSRQQKLVDFGRRMGLFGGKKEQERSSGMPYLMNGISVSTTSTVTFDPTPTPRELEGGRGSHDHGRSGRGRQVDAEAGLEEIPLDWSPRSLQATPPIYVSS